MSDKALAIIPRNITEVQTLSELISASALLPDALRGKLPDVIVSILAGAELGMPPMASIRGVHVVSGKPVLAAETMMGIVLGSGLAEYFAQVEASATSVTFETKRKGSPVPQRCTWTIEDAKRAGIYKNTWLAYPRQMLAARAKAELARSAYPDVCAGVYDPDEVANMVTSPLTTPTPTLVDRHPDAIDAEIVNETPEALTQALADIEAAESVDALKALAKSIQALKLEGAAKNDANAKYAARMAILKAPKTEAAA